MSQRRNNPSPSHSRRPRVTAEQENIAMYDGSLEFIEQRDIQREFENLRAASAERHLPAVQRCARRR